MTKQELKDKLEESNNSFIEYINSLSEREFLFQATDKWSAGQQLEHLLLSAKPLTQVFSMSKTMIKESFGVSNRPSKTYEALIEKYLMKLIEGGKAPSKFVPQLVAWNQKEALEQDLRKESEKLITQLDGFSEEELDTYIIPHPLLGKLTVREMMYFTIYHTGHHLQITKRNLKR